VVAVPVVMVVVVVLPGVILLGNNEGVGRCIAGRADMPHQQKRRLTVVAFQKQLGAPTLLARGSVYTANT
jgi:hypothetical protein